MTTRAWWTWWTIGMVLWWSVIILATPPSSGISLSPSAWTVRYSEGVARPKALSGMAGWYLDFPGANGSLNYVTTSTSSPLTGSITFTVQIVATSGDPVFQKTPEAGNICDYPAHVRAYIEQRYKGRGGGIIFAPPSYRWWANPIAVELSPGIATVTIPLTPDQWSNTNGQMGTTDPSGFAAALASPGAVGMTFGGGCFYGHGVQVVNGTARFILNNYAVVP